MKSLHTNDIPQTPAIVYDESIVIDKLNTLAVVREKTDCKIIYSIKAIPLRGLLRKIVNYVDGFSASSLFECRLAKEILEEVGDDQKGNTKTVHLTSPGLKKEELSELDGRADYISFNSQSQWQSHHSAISPEIQKGLRINPEQSFVKDERYDPCRTFSKLGMPLSQLKTEPVKGINGIHLHNNCESDDYTELNKTVTHVLNTLGSELSGMQWINLGGGYYINNSEQMDELESIIKPLKQDYKLDVFLEPGKGIVGSAGYLVSSVVDLFQSDGKNIAILDTTVNHLPEVFEYQYQPDVVEHKDDAKYEYRLAGSSCLSGDLFGDYCFEKPLEIGSRVTFTDIGAYMFVKANTFNGINLPSVYILDTEGKLTLEKEFSYEDFIGKY